jgi:HIV Tat-specific factor 1
LEECEAKLGKVRSIKVFRENPNGIVMIKFEKPSAAEGCIRLMNGRFFDEKELQCFYYDGKTNYDVRKIQFPCKAINL